MTSIDTQYAEIMSGVRAGEATRNEKEKTEGGFLQLPDPFLAAQWSLHKTQFDGRPYIRAACGQCKTIITTGQLDFVFRHCGEEEPIPVELRDRLEALQIKQGIRIQTFVDELLGKSRPAPSPAAISTPNLNAF